ncbi:MAG: TRAM domain-containing protein, partial [bacterium]
MHITITDLALGGDGVGRLPDGCAVFVPFTIPGEEVEVEIVTAHKRFARARLVEVVKPSPDRIAPRCPLFGRCGGCQYQHLTYDAQLAAKTRQLRETLARLGGFRDNLPEIAVVRSPHAFGYRNKIRLEKVSDNFSKSVFGFYSTDNETILPVEACPIALESLNQLLAKMAGPTPKTAGNLPSTAAFENRKSAIENTLTLRQPAVGEAVAFSGRAAATAPPLVEQVLGRDVRVAPDGFWQVNPGVAGELVRLVAAWAAEAPAEHLVDAYGGVGVFGLAAGRSCRRLTVIEMDTAAVRLARANFAAWGLTTAEFIAQPTERALPRLLAAVANANAVTTGLVPGERLMTGEDSPCSRTHTPSHVSTGASPVMDAAVPATQNSTFGIRNSKFSPPDVILDPPRGGCDAALLAALVKQ